QPADPPLDARLVCPPGDRLAETDGELVDLGADSLGGQEMAQFMDRHHNADHQQERHHVHQDVLQQTHGADLLLQARAIRPVTISSATWRAVASVICAASRASSFALWTRPRRSIRSSVSATTRAISRKPI